MPIIETKGSASSQGFGQFAQSGTANYIEDVFSTYLYTGNGVNGASTQNITNNIDLSTSTAALIWMKNRGSVTDHWLTGESGGGASSYLASNSTAARTNATSSVSSFNANGFTLQGSSSLINANGSNYVSWTFKPKPKFFDVVTWTGNAATPRTITHALGSVPGCIIVKKSIGTAEDWFVFHTSLGNTATFAYFLNLNNTNAQDTGGYGMEKSTSWTSTTFSLVSAGGSSLNESGATYVAYLFAHNAGGFGLTGTDNVISCGSCTGGSGTTVNLGYEPQWLLVKKTNAAQNWFLMDNMRGLNANQGDMALSPNTSGAEPTASGNFNITATGFTNAGLGTTSDTYIYIAIRRGPMKVPTSGTTVFSPNAITVANGVQVTTGFPADTLFFRYRGGINPNYLQSKLTSFDFSVSMQTNSTSAEAGSGIFGQVNNTGFTLAAFGGSSNIVYSFQRAPNFFDVVCYTGTGSNLTVNHNLGVVPELMIVKKRSATGNWFVAGSVLPDGGAGSSGYGSVNNNNVLLLNTTGVCSSGDLFSTLPTSTLFGVSSTNIGASGATFVAYLFATCAGVSKVGSYTGSGTLRTIDCGFTGGARFVLIKKTNSAGEWWLWDTARGMVAGTDPYLNINRTSVEVNSNSVYSVSTGFQILAAPSADVNNSGDNYIYLAIA